MNCITFGAPPITNPSLAPPPKINPDDDDNIILSVINEGDPVPRADFAYIMALLQLYTRGSPSDDMDVGKMLELPLMSAQNGGSICGLRVVEPGDEPTLGDQIRMVHIEPEIMRKTIAANPLAHSMELYAKNVAAYATSDMPSLQKKKYLSKVSDFEALPTVSEEAAREGPTFGGFKPWWEACDMEGHDQWCISSVADGDWVYVSYMFGVGPPIAGDESRGNAIKRIQDNIRDREIV
jgi:hypothetical protein